MKFKCIHHDFFLSLTAAHCVLDKDQAKPTLARELLMLLGAFNIDDPYEEGRLAVTPSEVIIHDNWNPSTERFNDDIAILMMEQEISFTKFIRSICLWNSIVEPSANDGIVAGWGTAGNSMQPQSIAKMLKIPIVKDNAKCYEENYLLAKIGSEKSFCAGKEGVGVCLGDSGSGLFIEVGNVFYLKGIVSSSLRDSSGCYTKNFAIYTNVMKYLDWIENPNGVEEGCGIMSSSAGLVQGGKISTQEQFPWVVAVKKYYTTVNGWEHTGSGSLISHKHVVTTANSVSYVKYGELYKAAENENIRLYLGTTKWNNTNEPGAVLIDGANGIEKMVLYPGTRAGIGSKKLLSINDLAAIFLKNSIQFSKFISPICLWKFDTKVSDQVGQIAYGVGYGRNENKIVTGIRKHAPMTITDDDECKGSVFREWIENDPTREYFCAKGDGNNFAYFFDDPLFMKTNGKWYLRGLIIGVSNVSPRIMIYEDQSAKFVEWISSVTQQ
jgi:hypothetical protein